MPVIREPMASRAGAVDALAERANPQHETTRKASVKTAVTSQDLPCQTSYGKRGGRKRMQGMGWWKNGTNSWREYPHAFSR